MDCEDVRHLVAKWIKEADRMERAMQEADHLTQMGRAALLHQATAMRGCAEELQVWSELR
jgi:hypothetical protein